MFAQKLKSSCKFISVSFGILSSYISYQYQQTVNERVDKTLIQNIHQVQQWFKGTSKFALNCTETYLLQYCQKLSTSPLFHQMDIASMIIFFANSQNVLLHELCVKMLSVVSFPEDVDMSYYVTQCKANTLVGLARSRLQHQKWFIHNDLQTFSVQDSDEDEMIARVKLKIDQLFIDIHQLLPSLKLDDNCLISMYSQVKDEQLPPDPVMNVMVDLCTERDNLQFTNQSQIPFKERLFQYLDILRRYSKIKEVVSNNDLSIGFIDTVKDLIQLYNESEEAMVICGNILANLAINSNNKEPLSVFLPLLLQWKYGDSSSLKITADRVLHNLDQIHNDEESSLLGDGIYILHPHLRENTKPDVDVVFIHGINGSPFYTWRQNETIDKSLFSKCWPKDWLPADYPNVRVLSVQYDSSLSEWLLTCPAEKERYSLDNQAKQIKEKLEKCNIGERPVIWVAHSMGGLIVKKLLMSSKFSSIESSTEGIVFYSTPHLGSPIATQSEKARFILFPSVEVNELSETSAKLKELHKNFSKYVDKHRIKCVDFGETKPLSLPYIKLKSIVVLQSSSNVGYGRYILLDSNHQDICKPLTRADIKYTEVGDMIKYVLNKASKNK